MINLAQRVLFHVGAHGLRAGSNHGLIGRGFRQRIDVTDLRRHDHDLMWSITNELGHPLSGAKLHHVRRRSILRHLAHAGARATAFGMDNDGSLWITLALPFDVVRANTVMDMARA